MRAHRATGRAARRAALVAILATTWLVGGGAASVAAVGDPILVDGFESGDLSGWDPATYCPAASTYALTESPPGLALWTTPAASKVLAADGAPPATASGLRLFAARREFEPLVVAARATTDTVTITGVSLAPFPELGPDQTIEVRRAIFAGDWPERLDPLALPVVLPSDTPPLVLWITVFVPPAAPAGLHTSTLTLDVSGQDPVVVPVELRVFDATLPDAATFRSQLLVGFPLPADAKKQLLFDHRLTPATPTWPSGFRWSITWDQSVHPATRCTTFDDETDHESAVWAVGSLAQKWLLGTDWNDVGFPSGELFRFVSNAEPRPATFCGIGRETGTVDPPHFGSAAYNAEWSDFLAGLDAYLQETGLAAKTHYYVLNEPQNQTDYDLAAHLCRLARTAAPTLRLAISEEPKPAIAEHAAGACGYDLWFAHVGELKRQYAATRQALGEEVWYYSLPQDFFVNPMVVERPGMDVRMLPWIAWADRVRGWLTDDGDSLFSAGQPTVRLELLREGFEDYEYLWLANGGAHPQPGVDEVADRTARSAARSEIEWNRDADAQAALRCELGRFLEGHRTRAPVLTRTGTRPRAAYYLNFQNPLGEPLADPLVVDGKVWTKIGWSAWDDGVGYGWTGPFVGNTGVLLYGYNGGAEAFDDVERSWVYDDFGRPNLFEFDLENGRYTVTVGVGRAGLAGGHHHNLVVEGTRIVDDEIPTDVLVRSTEVELTDGRLSLVVGGPSEATGTWAYTFLAFVEIEPAP